MMVILCPLLHLATTRSPKVLIFLVGCNVNFIILDGESFIFKRSGNLILFKISLHAGLSTTEVKYRQGIPHSAFVDAVNEYEADSETDDEGSMLDAEI